VVTPWKSLPSFLTEFKNWLVSPDARNKPLRQANQHVVQVSKIWAASSSGIYDIEPLFNRINIRDNWLVEFESSNKEPATVKAYIESLRHFYNFVISDEPKMFREFLKKCPGLVVVCTSWISNYRKKQKQSRWKKDLKQLSQLFTPADIKRLDVSNVVKYAKKLLKTRNCPPSMKEFTTMRDYLLMYLCLDNASRTGALANMTLDEFQRSKCLSGSYRINVLLHKTLATSGPACIVASVQLMAELNSYVFVRNSLHGVTCEPTDNVFISWSGSEMSSPMVIHF